MGRHIDKLKQRFLLHVWRDMDQCRCLIIDKAVDEWRGRLHACVWVCKGWTL